MMNRSALIRARNEAVIKSVIRKERLAALNEYIGFVTTKLVGLGSLVIAVMEFINPAFHPVKLVPAESLFAFGLALLIGPKVMEILSKVVNALKP
jgi:hypothetical protein